MAYGYTKPSYGFEFPGLGQSNQQAAQSGGSNSIPGLSGAVSGGSAGAAAGPYGAVIGAVVGGAADIIGTGMSEDPYNPGAAFKLPPALEIAMLRSTNRNLIRLQRDYRDLDRRQRAVDQGLGISQDYLDGKVSDSDFARFQQSNLEDVQGLRQLESQDFKDPQLEGQLSDEKARLEQELARAGVGPTGRARALGQFDRLASERRFSRTEQLRSGRTDRTLQRFQAGLNLSQTLTNSQLAFGSARRDLRQEDIKTYQQLGQFDYSDQARQALGTGLVGPGSVRQQTGISEENLDLYSHLFRERENLLNERDIMGSIDPKRRGASYSGGAGGPVKSGRARYELNELRGFRR